MDALLQDLETDHEEIAGRGIGSIFIGGGTPSLFSEDAIGKLLEGVKGRCVLLDDCEITLEANPGSAEAGRFAGYLAAGVNRLSIGIQSFDDEHLRALGRIHTAAQARAAIESAKSVGFEQFNLDLMHGLPDQTVAAALADLEAALAFSPPHLSWYQLTIEQNTAFYNAPPRLPVEDTLADIQEHGEARIAAVGLHNYEVSAYAREGFRARHNLNYWEFGDYIGIGAGAHSKVTLSDGTLVRYARRRQPDSYLQASPAQRICNRQMIGPESAPGEFMLNALRLSDGFNRHLFTERTGLSFEDVQGQVDALIERGLLASDEDRIHTTALGRRFLDSVVAEFL